MEDMLVWMHALTTLADFHAYARAQLAHTMKLYASVIKKRAKAHGKGKGKTEDSIRGVLDRSKDHIRAVCLLKAAVFWEKNSEMQNDFRTTLLNQYLALNEISDMVMHEISKGTEKYTFFVDQVKDAVRKFPGYEDVPELQPQPKVEPEVRRHRQPAAQPIDATIAQCPFPELKLPPYAFETPNPATYLGADIPTDRFDWNNFGQVEDPSHQSVEKLRREMLDYYTRKHNTLLDHLEDKFVRELVVKVTEKGYSTLNKALVAAGQWEGIAGLRYANTCLDAAKPILSDSEDESDDKESMRSSPPRPVPQDLSELWQSAMLADLERLDVVQRKANDEGAPEVHILDQYRPNPFMMPTDQGQYQQRPGVGSSDMHNIHQYFGNKVPFAGDLERQRRGMHHERLASPNRGESNHKEFRKGDDDQGNDEDRRGGGGGAVVVEAAHASGPALPAGFRFHSSGSPRNISIDPDQFFGETRPSGNMGRPNENDFWAFHVNIDEADWAAQMCNATRGLITDVPKSKFDEAYISTSLQAAVKDSRKMPVLAKMVIPATLAGSTLQPNSSVASPQAHKQINTKATPKPPGADSLTPILGTEKPAVEIKPSVQPATKDKPAANNKPTSLKSTDEKQVIENLKRAPSPDLFQSLKKLNFPTKSAVNEDEAPSSTGGLASFGENSPDNKSKNKSKHHASSYILSPSHPVLNGPTLQRLAKMFTRSCDIKAAMRKYSTAVPPGFSDISEEKTAQPSATKNSSKEILTQCPLFSTPTVEGGKGLKRTGTFYGRVNGKLQLSPPSNYSPPKACCSSSDGYVTDSPAGTVMESGEVCKAETNGGRTIPPGCAGHVKKGGYICNNCSGKDSFVGDPDVLMARRDRDYKNSRARAKRDHKNKRGRLPKKRSSQLFKGSPLQFKGYVKSPGPENNGHNKSNKENEDQDDSNKGAEEPKDGKVE